MEPAKAFNNVIIGQFVLTGVPVKVYVDGQFLTITDTDDVEDPTMGFGMDVIGKMRHFDYRNIERLLVSGNEIDLDTYNKGMGAKEEPAEEESAEEEPKKEESTMKLGNLLKEVSAEEVDAEIEGAEAQIDAAKAKFKAAQAAMKDTMKKSKDKIKAAKANLKVADEGIIKEDHHYTFGVGDIVKNKNQSCPHYGSMGVVKKLMDLPNNMGTVVLYTVTNDGLTYKSGDVLSKTMDQLEPVARPDAVE